jgi:hypothetical protein
VLKEILKNAGIARATVTSVSRTVAEQARIMYDNLEDHGIPFNRRMYATSGNRVIDVYEANLGKSEDELKALMKKKIEEIGPTRVSNHISNSHYTFDVGPRSIPVEKHKAFENAVRAHKAVTTLIPPPVDPAFHIEIPKNSPHL